MVLALEPQLATDLGETGKLAAIATIRTLLNFFLAHKRKDERAEDLSEHAEQRDGRQSVAEARLNR